MRVVGRVGISLLGTLHSFPSRAVHPFEPLKLLPFRVPPPPNQQAPQHQHQRQQDERYGGHRHGIFLSAFG